jgi:2-amino-4-hydroxy-6-hydroxymethyldihydropteridine diphosphokinase
MLWQPAYIALGSNLGDSIAMIERAVEAIGSLPDTRLLRRSSLYRTPPFGPVVQADFINAVVGVLTRNEAPQLWQQLRSLELAMGRRERRTRWGPREIDLDLLVHGNSVREDAELTLPHPGIPERDFVLYPLRDVAAELLIPRFGRVRELAVRVEDRGVERLA